MISHPLLKHAAVLAAFALLAGCGAVSPGTSRAALGADVRRSAGSWMDANAAKGALLYVSDTYSGSVSVYTYPQGKLAGTLYGFNGVGGICADANGNVWVPNSGIAEIMEFAHGGTTPIAIVGNTGHSSGACAVDPKTGNLAVANFPSPDGGTASVSIYKGAKAKQVTVSAKMDAVLALGYDKRGDLYVSGSHKGVFKWAELRRGTNGLEGFRLRLHSVGIGIAFDGKRIVVQSGAGKTISQVSGEKIVRQTTLSGLAGDVSQLSIDGSTLVLAQTNAIELYAYPAGGKPTKTVSITLQQPVGTALSY